MRAQRTPEQYISEVLGQDAMQIMTLLRNLGLWTSDYHKTPFGSKPFNTQVSQLTSEGLANEIGYWTSEFQRTSELLGYLRGYRAKIDSSLKREWAVSRNRIREREASAAAREARAVKKFTTQEINDLAMTEEPLAKLIDDLDNINVLYYQVEQAKEYIEAARTTLSREITRRGDLQRNGL